jgi:hypothetical protein
VILHKFGGISTMAMQGNWNKLWNGWGYLVPSGLGGTQIHVNVLERAVVEQTFVSERPEGAIGERTQPIAKVLCTLQQAVVKGFNVLSFPAVLDATIPPGQDELWENKVQIGWVSRSTWPYQADSALRTVQLIQINTSWC